MTMSAPVRVAVSQHEPMWLDLEASVDKTCSIIAEAAKGGAKLVAFPECWIPGYPAWIWSRPVDFELGVRYVKNSLRVDSPEMKRICDAAASNAINVSLGFSENDADSVYIAQALIGDDGEIKMRRRKMKPTHMERTIFGDASGECLSNVVGVPGIGKVGSLACWEHIQPLLKYFMIAQKVNVHVSAWPPLEPFIEGSPGLWSMSAEGCRAQSQIFAVEAQAHVLHCTSAISTGVDLMKTAGSPVMGCEVIGSSAVFGPDGRAITSPETTSEKIIFADLDFDAVVKAKTFLDVTGHCIQLAPESKAYLANKGATDSRPDLLWLGADPRSKQVVRSEKKELE